MKSVFFTRTILLPTNAVPVKQFFLTSKTFTDVDCLPDPPQNHIGAKKGSYFFYSERSENDGAPAQPRGKETIYRTVNTTYRTYEVNKRPVSLFHSSLTYLIS